MAVASGSDPIGRTPDRRKLIAVVYMDMVGYSRLIGLDDRELSNDCGYSVGT